MKLYEVQFRCKDTINKGGVHEGDLLVLDTYNGTPALLTFDKESDWVCDLDAKGVLSGYNNIKPLVREYEPFNEFIELLKKKMPCGTIYHHGKTILLIHDEMTAVDKAGRILEECITKCELDDIISTWDFVIGF